MTSFAQIIQTQRQTPLLQTLYKHLNAASIIDDAIMIQQVAAPTFHEQQRAELVTAQFARYGLHDITTDALHNVYGRWPGRQPKHPALLISAHTDTVFPAETSLTIRRDAQRIYGPGLGDNSLGVAALLALIRTFREHDVHPAADIWFVANSREEGLGDLGGIRAVWEQLGDRLGAAIVLEGLALGRIYHAGIAVRRLHITCHAPGGHSWLHFGQPSAIHALIALGAHITALTPPQNPRTTFNIGLINGGHSVNSLATTADLYLDLRSAEPEALADLEQRVRTFVAEAQQQPLTFDIDVVGDRPAGNIGTDHGLVQLAAAALEAIDYTPIYESGSTDANALLAHGLPTVTVGITHGGQAHRLDEYIDTPPIFAGMWQLILLTLAAADHIMLWQH
jgi:tripeptide aminopeptidase